MSTPWRLLTTPPARGSWNMAVDEAILESTARGEALPTLRLFSWQPACLSLGYAQPVADVDRARLVQRGWDLVRRPTGGKAILHTDELTYSVTGPQTEPRLAGSVLESYRRLSIALLKALHLLGIPAQSQAEVLQDANQPKGPVCFEVPSNYEITVEGKKLIGSAQARRREGVLQHGALPLHGDLTRITAVLAFADEAERSLAAERLLKRAMTAETVLGYPLDWNTTAQAFATAFEQTLDLALAPAELTPTELQRAAELERDKYSHPSWTERV
jgi:lipoyl(octanoyl) transferase